MEPNLDVPEGTNRYPTKCKECGQMIPAGGGILYKRGGPRTCFQGKWLIEHDGCPGAKPEKLTNAGWVYAFTSLGPDGSWIKVGMTGTSIADRILSQIGGKNHHAGFNLKDSQVWAAPTNARYAAEAAAHEILVAYRIHPSLKRGRELFRTDLPTVLNAIRIATGAEPQYFPWDFSKWYLSLKGDPFEQEDRGVRISNPPPDERVAPTKRVVRAWVGTQSGAPNDYSDSAGSL